MSDKTYILSLDQGTTSSRAVVYDRFANTVAMSQKETRQFFPCPGHVEQNADEIWENQKFVAVEAMAKAGISPDQIACIGITNQRESTVVWEKESGKAIHPVIIWQDRRTADICNDLRNAGLAPEIKEKTGLLPDAYFSATKLMWTLQHVPGARKLAESGKLCFGTIDSWLIWKLSGGKSHLTDVSNASRTMMFNIHTLKWDEALLAAFDIPGLLLPEVRSNREIIAMTDVSVFGTQSPVCGMAGDQQAALYGQHCLSPGMAKNTYGTGCFMLMNTGEQAVSSRHGLLTTIAWLMDKKPVYALEGSVFVAGALIKWLRDSLGLIVSADETAEIAASVPHTASVHIVPAFTGLGAPYWNMDARGIISGLTLGADRRHIVRAALEAMAYQTADVLTAMEKDACMPLNTVYADGGASANDFLLQFQSDILNKTIIRPAGQEATAFGAACMAAEFSGLWNDETYRHQASAQKVFKPAMTADLRNSLMADWHEAVKRCLGK